MNILVTGAAGFIGYNFIKQLLNNKKIKIIGIDIFEDYYDVNLKKKRILDLKKNKNFKFSKINIHKEKIYLIYLKKTNLILFIILLLRLV